MLGHECSKSHTWLSQKHVVFCYRHCCNEAPGRSAFLGHSRLHAHTHRQQHTARCHAIPAAGNQQHSAQLQAEDSDTGPFAQPNGSIDGFGCRHNIEHRQEVDQQGSDSCCHTQLAGASRQRISKAIAASSCPSSSQSRQANDAVRWHEQHQCKGRTTVSEQYTQHLTRCQLDSLACDSGQHRSSGRQYGTSHMQRSSQHLVLQRRVQQSRRRLHRSLHACLRPVWRLPSNVVAT